MSACYIEFRSKAVVFLLLILFADRVVSVKAHSPSELTSPNRNVSIARGVLISYVAYYPQTFTDYSPNARVYRQCKSNFDEFLIRTTTTEPLVHFVFSLVGDTPISEMLSKVKKTQKNVEIIHAENRQIDLFAHAQQISRYIDQKEFFVLLNCGARGPYYSFKRNPPTPNLLWLIRFISPLKGDVKMAGTTISCEVSPHVQSYAMSVDAVGAKILIDLWQSVSTDTNSASKLQQIAMFEVGASSAILSKGYNIASLDSRYAGRDFRQKGVKCDPEFSNRVHPTHLNPTVCRTDTANPLLQPSGCRGIEPCEVIIVKYGGEALNDSLIPFKTTNRLNIEDNRKRICKDSWRPFAPYWDVPSILDGLLRDNHLRHLGSNIAASEMFVVVRANGRYVVQLESMLQFLQTIQSCTISVIVIPTEKGSFASLNDGLKAFSTKSTSPSLSILDVPDSLYDQYGAYIESLCTAEQRQGIQNRGYAKESIDHMCRVNSPLHNLLSDLMLEYIKRDAASSQWLIVTDVDNSYSPEFFTFVSSVRKKADIALVNMKKDNVVNSTSKALYAGLGSFAVSIPFLRKSGATFLSSIPLRPAAHHYHDADGHFIKALLTHGARAIKTETILFTRNPQA
jgi:hypothetical protein